MKFLLQGGVMSRVMTQYLLAEPLLANCRVPSAPRNVSLLLVLVSVFVDVGVMVPV